MKARRRISLGMKQCQSNSLDDFALNHKKGRQGKGPDQVHHRFRPCFIGLDGGHHGLVHLSDLSWTQPGEEMVRTTRRATKSKLLCLRSTLSRAHLTRHQASWKAIRSVFLLPVTRRRSGYRYREVIGCKGCCHLSGKGDSKRTSGFRSVRPIGVEDIRNPSRRATVVTAVIINVDRKKSRPFSCLSALIDRVMPRFFDPR